MDDNQIFYRRSNSGFENGAPNDHAGEMESSETLGSIFGRFAEHCSLQGVPYIYHSHSLVGKTVWCFLLLAATAGLSYHLYTLFATYLSYPTQNSIALGYSSLQFPAVTICNVNPIRRSKISLLSENIQDLINFTDPKNVQKRIDENNSSSTGHAQNSSSSQSSNQTSSSKKASTNSQLFSSVNSGNFSTRPQPSSSDDEGEQSGSSLIEQQFMELLAMEDRETRMEVGHQLSDMLISCSFSGKVCYASDFTNLTSNKYGNCYTLQSNKFISKTSGSTGGLELLMYLQTDEYIRGITPDTGVQVVIHPLSSMPFPADEGFAVSGATNTLVSMKRVNVIRAGLPYEACSSNQEFSARYHVVYTRKTCEEFCLQRLIYITCSCKDETEDEINMALNATYLPACMNQSDVDCLSNVTSQYQNDNQACNCNNPCSDTNFEKSVTFRKWPDEEYSGVLVALLCETVDDDLCEILKNKNASDLQEDFLMLNIFYEELNYENITEDPSYKMTQFFSDVGGILGLWIGVSILSIFEVLQFFMEIIRFVFCCRFKKTGARA